MAEVDESLQIGVNKDPPSMTLQLNQHIHHPCSEKKKLTHHYPPNWLWRWQFWHWWILVGEIRRGTPAPSSSDWAGSDMWLHQMLYWLVEFHGLQYKHGKGFSRTPWIRVSCYCLLVLHSSAVWAPCLCSTRAGWYWLWRWCNAVSALPSSSQWIHASAPKWGSANPVQHLHCNTHRCSQGHLGGQRPSPASQTKLSRRNW